MFPATVPGKRYAVCMTMPMRRRNSRGFNRTIVLPIEENSTARGFVEAIEQPQERRLARSTRADYCQHLARLHPNADVSDQHLVRNCAGQILCFDQHGAAQPIPARRQAVPAARTSSPITLDLTMALSRERNAAAIGIDLGHELCRRAGILPLSRSCSSKDAQR